jgi:N-acetylglutamate synthase-like GNAT family acetyltransferase
MLVRSACSHDIEEMVSVVRRSITELCVQEYRNDPAVLQRWLENKTPESFRRWIADAKRLVIVAVGGSGILGVGMMSSDGEILLNYVSPDYRFQGVSKELVKVMERHAQSMGVCEVRLLSTRLASHMYSALGYHPIADEASRFGTLPGLVMRKKLAVDRLASSGIC